MNENYRIPHEIKNKLPDYFYYAMWGELVSIFGTDIMIPECYEMPKDELHGVPKPFYPLAYDTSTSGWNQAFFATCQKLNFMEVYNYYDSLDWYDSDKFDGEIEEELYQHMPGINNTANPYYKYLMCSGLKKIRENA